MRGEENQQEEGQMRGIRIQEGEEENLYRGGGGVWKASEEAEKRGESPGREQQRCQNASCSSPHLCNSDTLN